MSVETRQPDALAIIFVFLGAATLTLALRVTSRGLMRQFYWDDALVVLAWAISVAQTGTAAAWMKASWYGYRSSDVPALSVDQQIFASKMMFVEGLLYNPVLGLVKWSIIVFLMRLDDKRRPIRLILWALLVVNIGHMTAVFFGVVFQCTPAHMYWDHYKTDQVIDGEVVNDNYSCFDQASFSLSTAGISVFTDISILMVPIAMMWNLRMPVRRKVAVVFVLSLGWVVAIVGIIRIKYFVDFWYGNFPDPSWSLWNTLSGVENGVAIMVACAPAIKALVTLFSPKFFGTSKDRPTESPYYASSGYQLESRPRLDRSGHASHAVHLSKSDSTEAIVRSESLGESSKHADSPDKEGAIQSHTVRSSGT